MGGFTRRITQEAGGHWLDRLRNNVELGAGATPADLVGENTFVQVSWSQTGKAAAAIKEAVEQGGRGTRATMEVDPRQAGGLGRMGFRQEHGGITPSGYVYWSIGTRGGRGKSLRLDHALCKPHMDPKDVDKKVWADDSKRERAWEPVPWDPELWRGKGLPAAVEAVMTQGTVVELHRALHAREIPQYPFASQQAQMEASIEADRAIATGHMSYIPPDEVEEALLHGAVHPWTMAQQGSKWRACQDYSGITNRAATSAPFGLPTPWDVKKVIRPGKTHFVKYDLRDGFWAVPVHPESKNCLMMRHPATGRLMRCDRLPFGYIDSPRVFCSVTEAMAQMFRERTAGRGMHIWCYVDDYLLAGDTDALAREAGAIFEQILEEMGFVYAPHKQRGPCRCIEFLGLLIVNTDEYCCIALSEKRQLAMQGLIDEWLLRRPRKGAADAEPRELARLLGLLVFASQVVPGGRVYMQGMLSQFQGLEVDWKRGLVKPTNGHQWGSVRLGDAFWRDLEWWSDSLQFRNCTSLLETELGEAAVTGTDASGWGSGQVAWIDGGKEESRLRFGKAENRRPINWRELSGIVRIIELYGEQLAGRCVLVETDNMAAKGAASGMSSKASDMQELVRRLFELSEKHSIVLKFVHTPGIMLHRPDQTSRGDPIEEPRARLRRSAFGMLDKRFGPFTEFIGAERQHRQTDGAGIQPGRLWVHPTFTTVGSALRLIGERLMAADGERAAGVVVVPDSEGTRWRSLLKHFLVVGRRPEGDIHLEKSQMGRWRHVTSLRPELILSFPRAAGSFVRQVWTSREELEMGGRCITPTVGGRHLPLQKGSLVYSPAPVAGTPGCLYIVWRDYDPSCEKDLNEGRPDVHLAELLFIPNKEKGDRKPARGKGLYFLDNSVVSGDHGKRQASFGGMSSRAWRVEAETVWTVDHLVAECAPTWKTRPIRKGEGQAAQWARKAFSFDFREAEKQIAHAMAAKKQESALADAGRVRKEVQRLEAEELVGGLAKLGAEDEPGPSEVLARATQAANDAAAARTHPRAVERGAQEPPLASEARSRQICRYVGQECFGCGRAFKVGEVIAPGGDGMVCSNVMADGRNPCYELARVQLLEAAEAAKAKRRDREGVKLTSDKREAQITSRFREERLVMCLKCIDGRCGIDHEKRNMCMGARDAEGNRNPCGRGLHGVSCGQLAKAQAATGLMVCPYCRAEEASEVSCGEGTTLLKQGCRSMLLELSSGATKTAVNVAEFERLEREFVLHTYQTNGTLLREPRYSEESYIMWMTWLVTEAKRARSFGTLIRMSAKAMATLELKVIPSLPRVKKLIKELADQIGTEPEPCTIPSTAIVRTMLDKVLAKRCSSSEYIYARSLVMFDMETAGGCRLGETAGGGEGHGALAELVDIAIPLDGTQCTVNIRLEDSKTGFGRDVTYVTETQGRLNLQCGENLRRLWSTSGFTICHKTIDGVRYVRPDYKVVRLSLLGMTVASHTRLLKLVGNATTGVIFERKSEIKYYLTLNYSAETKGEESKFVNIAGGPEGCREIESAVKWLREFGYGDMHAIVPGPLLRATAPGRPKEITHMPIKPGSTYAHVPTACLEAWKLNQQQGLVDDELDLEGREEPKIGHHGNRRKADKEANDTRHLTGVTEGEIDDHFGWNQKERKKTSRLHYHGRNERLKRARVTMMI